MPLNGKHLPPGYKDSERILMLRGMVTAFEHLAERDLGILHMKVLLAVAAFEEMPRPIGYPTQRKIELVLGLEQGSSSPAIIRMCDMRYLHEMLPKYGDLIPTYKLGSMGGAFVKRIRLSSE